MEPTPHGLCGRGACYDCILRRGVLDTQARGFWATLSTVQLYGRHGRYLRLENKLGAEKLRPGRNASDWLANILPRMLLGSRSDVMLCSMARLPASPLVVSSEVSSAKTGKARKKPRRVVIAQRISCALQSSSHGEVLTELPIAKRYRSASVRESVAWVGGDVFRNAHGDDWPTPAPRYAQTPQRESAIVRSGLCRRLLCLDTAQG